MRFKFVHADILRKLNLVASWKHFTCHRELTENTIALRFGTSEEPSARFLLFFSFFYFDSNRLIDIISRCHSRHRYRFRIILASGWRNLIGGHVIPSSIRALACQGKKYLPARRVGFAKSQRTASKIVRGEKFSR